MRVLGRDDGGYAAFPSYRASTFIRWERAQHVAELHTPVQHLRRAVEHGFALPRRPADDHGDAPQLGPVAPLQAEGELTDEDTGDTHGRNSLPTQYHQNMCSNVNAQMTQGTLGRERV